MKVKTLLIAFFVLTLAAISCKSKKEMWSNAVKNEQNLLDFLEDQIYNEKSVSQLLQEGFEKEQKENEE